MNAEQENMHLGPVGTGWLHAVEGSKAYISGGQRHATGLGVANPV